MFARLRLWLARKILPRGWYIASCGLMSREFAEELNRVMREPPAPWDPETQDCFGAPKPSVHVWPRAPMHPPRIQELRAPPGSTGGDLGAAMWREQQMRCERSPPVPDVDEAEEDVSLRARFAPPISEE